MVPLPGEEKEKTGVESERHLARKSTQVRWRVSVLACMRALLLAVAALFLVAATVSAHPSAPNKGDAFYKWGEQNSPTFSAAMKNVPDPKFEEGPCTEEARRSMPAGKDHDHEDINQHRFACNMRQTAFNSLTKELGARPDVVMGEMDVKGDLAAVAVAYPESGFLLFDVKDSANPKFLSWYRGDECEGTFADIDCGAFVDISPDGKRVYISVQAITVVGGQAPKLGVLPASYPGIDVVDISDRKSPKLTDKRAVQSVGGVHTTRSFDVPGKGEFTVSVANGIGAVFHKVVSGALTPVGTIKIDELHDTFIQQDPLTKKTLMYVAGGFDTGFYVFDISDPANPVGLAEWDITPECESDWYSHTLDVTTVNGRRIVTMPVELIDFFGDQSKADQAEGCGKLQGNGDFAGPLYIVDATDFSKLSKATPEDEATPEVGDPDEYEEADPEMKSKSEKSLITTWSNAAKRAGGRLVFTPHNQQIVGNQIYLSSYHSGVTVLDATEAFAGKNVRPKEIGVVVPTGQETRPIHPDAGGELFDQFFTSFIKYRPTIWDMQWHKGHVLAADMTGGFYAFQLTDDVKLVPEKTDGGGSAAAPAAAGAAQGTAPRAGTARRGARCKSTRKLKITLKDPRGREAIRSVRVLVNGKGVSTLRGTKLRRAKSGARFRVPVTLAGKRKGRQRVQVVARTNRGRTIRLNRAYRTCTKR